MSFQNNSFLRPNGSGSLANGEMVYDNSTRIDHKRGHQWFTGSSEQELFFNKKQAIESAKETSRAEVMDNSLWRHSSSSQSGIQTGGGLFSPKPVRISNISNKPITISDTVNKSITVSDFVNKNIPKNGSENQFGNDPSVCLTMSNAVDNPRTFYPGETNKKMGLTFQRIGNNNVCVGPTYNPADANTISVGLASSKRDSHFMLHDQYYNGIDNNMLSIGQAFSRGNYDINSVGEQYVKENSNFMSMGPTPTYSKGHTNFYSDPFYNKPNETFISAGPVYNADTSVVVPYSEESSGQQTTTISFGGFQDKNPEESDPYILVNESSGASGEKDSSEQLSANVVSAATSKTDVVQKIKEPKKKKASSNNFPVNVKSLLSTGILDGVPVKYVSWSREKNLRGVVRGTGYLCGCQDCKLNKVINAYEFERHAGCKTKHPNNHIYFENGKTIYAVVQELKNAPQEILFDVIQNVTGSPINQKNFQIWKASYKAASRELQRIYGQDEVIVVPS